MHDTQTQQSLYEQFRLARLQRLGILDTPPEERFDRITAIARDVYGVGIALVSLVDEKRQWFKSSQGVDVCATARDIAVCDHAIRQDDVFLVNDATQDERFKNNPLVTGPLHLRFYAGMPIREPTGFKIGTLCVIDKEPRQFSEADFDTLKHLARLVETEIERNFGLNDSRPHLHPGKLNKAIHRAQNLVLGAGTTDDAFQILLNDLLMLTGAQFGLITHMHARKSHKTSMHILAMSEMDHFPVPDTVSQALRAFAEDPAVSPDDWVTLDARLKMLLAPAPDNAPPQGPTTLSMPVVLSGEFAGLACLMFDQAEIDPGMEQSLSPLLHTIGILIERIRLQQERVQSLQKMQRSVQRDELTGALNRKGFSESVAELIEADPTRSNYMTLYVLDLDNFGVLNEENGREVGDQVLKHLARRLGSIGSGNCVIGRFGGDEFALLVKDDCDAGSYPLIQAMLAEGINGLRVQSSVGAAVYPQDAEETEQLVRFAYKALFDAKENGKDRCQRFDMHMHQSMIDVIALREQIRQALSNHELTLFYQPKVSLQTGLITGFEALIRWQHPLRGLVMPDQFLPAIQHTQLDVQLGMYVLDTAVSTLKRFEAEGLPYGVSINVSPQHFLSSGFVDHLATVLADFSEELRGRLTLEIIETAAIDDQEMAQNVIRQCQRLGVKISLDDFGTGFSSLSYFRELPMDEVKIDRSFVFNLLTVPEDAMIVESIVDLCRRFGREVVAEGIESAEHANKLKELGCTGGQGYHYSKAMPLDEAIAWVGSYVALYDSQALVW